MFVRSLRRLVLLAAFATGIAHGHGPTPIPADTPVVALDGRVDALIIEDPARAAMHRIPVLVTAAGSYVLRGGSADTLAAGTPVAVQAKVARDLAAVESVDATGPADPRAFVAKSARSATWIGRLRLGHADNFDGQPSYFFYSLHAAGSSPREVRLAADTGVLANGMQVSVRGELAADGAIVPDRIVIESREDAVAPQAKATTNQVLVLPIKFKNDVGVFPADPFAISAIQSAVFGASSSAADFFEEMSYGQQLLSGQVAHDVEAGTGAAIFLKGADAAPLPSACNYSWIASQAEAAATAKGYNLASYQNIVYVFHAAGFNCGWSGLAYVGWGRAWIRQTTSLLVIVHELGHNFGLLHAGSLDCGTNVIGGSCSVSEYGDPFGVMGNNRSMHFNAMQKRELAWIADTTTPTHASGTTTYTLSPLENGGQTRYAVRVPAASNRTYWIEYRQPIGYDNGLSSFPNNGAQIRVASPFETSSGSDDTQFLDMTPATPAFTDGTLVAGQSFTDSVYGMTVNVLSASPTALSVQVVKSGLFGTTTQLYSSLNPANVGQSITFTAYVTGLAPTGSVNFRNGASSIAGCSAVALTGTGDQRYASCVTTSLPQGALSITGVYSGNGANATSTSPPVAQVMNGGLTATTTTLASSLNPSIAGQSVTLTATVTGNAPTGNVAFRDGGTNIGGCSAIALAGSGNTRTATCTTTALAQGTRSLSANYGGNASNAGSTSSALSQVVKAATATTLASSLNPSTVGQSVTFTASVTGVAPTGTVAFRDGGTNIGGCSAVALTGAGNTRTATCATTALVQGTRSISALYAGDTTNTTSTSATLSQVVNAAAPAPTTTTLASSLNPSTAGQSVTLTATITGVAPTGNVNFRDGATSIGSCSAVALTGSGNSRTATCTTTALAQGTRSLSAVYAGNASNATSTSSTLSQVVKTVSSAALASSLNPSTVGQSVTLTATVTGTAPTGSVNFRDGATSIGGCSAVALTGAGNSRTATCATSALAQGTRAISAVYAGDAGNATSTSTTLSQVVNAAGGGGGSTNVARASNGGVASASSFATGFDPANVINGELAGVNWSAGGGWKDATNSSYPDWLQVLFNGQKTIDRVVVYSIQDNFGSPSAPTDSMTFALYGVTAFEVQTWNGSAWVTQATVTGNNLVKRTVTFAAVATDRIRVNITNALNGSSRLTEVEAFTSGGAGPAATTTTLASSLNPSTVGQSVTFTATVTGTAPTGSVNFRDGATSIGGCSAVALTGAGNSRTATCSTSALVQGTRPISAVYAGDAGNATSTSTTLSQVVNPAGAAPTSTTLASSLNPSTVGQSVTFTATVTGTAPTGNVNFRDGATSIGGCSAVTLTGAGNSRTATCATSALVQGTRAISAVYAGDAGNATSTSTTLSQVVNAASGGGPSTNVARASNGGIASASSFATGYDPANVINGELAGVNWSAGGGWKDATSNSYPDWLQVLFNGQKTIDRVVVYSIQDNFGSPSAPTDGMTFAFYGVTAFEVQTWNGSAWVTQATVSGNNLVKRTVTFAAVATDRIRVNITNALNGSSRLTEVEAWTP